MIKKLTKHGDDLALVIDRSILDQLGIDETTPLEVSTDGQKLVVSQASELGRQQQIKEALVEGNALYADALRRLAE